jgi:hypothetical protein
MVAGRPKGNRNRPKQDFNLLTEEEKFRLTEQAEKQVAAERHDEARKAFLADQVSKERRGAGLEEELVTDTFELAFDDRIVIDGVTYFAGRPYTLPKARWAVLREAAARVLDHVNETDGKSKFQNRSKGTRIRPGTGGSAVVMRA